MKDYTYNQRPVSLSFHWTLKLKVLYRSIRSGKSVEKTEVHYNVLGDDRERAELYWVHQVKTSSRALIAVLEATRCDIAYAFYNDDEEHEFLSKNETNELYKSIENDELGNTKCKEKAGA